MSTIINEVEEKFALSSNGNLFGDANPYVSELSNLQVMSATSMEITYTKPDDGMDVCVKIWSGLVADIKNPPIFTLGLHKIYTGKVTVNTPEINLNKGLYTVAICSEDNLVVAATQTILNGQLIQAGSSTLFVQGKNLTSINLTFNMPANVTGNETITWFILYEGSSLGKGNRLATQTAAPGTSSGLTQIAFPAGLLREGREYNVVLNPGRSTSYITAGYVFKYVLQ
jgi:hypothetical protein